MSLRGRGCFLSRNMRPCAEKRRRTRGRWEIASVEGCTHELRKALPAQWWISINSLSRGATQVEFTQAWSRPGRDNKKTEGGRNVGQWTCAGPGLEPQHWGELQWSCEFALLTQRLVWLLGAFSTSGPPTLNFLNAEITGVNHHTQVSNNAFTLFFFLFKFLDKVLAR